MRRIKTLYSPESAAFSQWLKSQRECKGHTIRSLGELLGWHHSIIGKIEQGERRIDVVEYVQLCEALCIDPLEGVEVIKNAV